MNVHTIDHWLRNTARRTPQRVAIDYLGREVTYGELDRRSDAFAAEFARARAASRRPRRDAHGQLARARDRVLRLREGRPDPAAAQLAARGAGAALPARGRGAVAVPRRGRVRGARRGDGSRRSRPLAPPDGETRAPVSAEVAGDDALLLIYTSGTTGRPKGAMLTHANCFWTNLSFDLATGLTGDDVVLQVLPQFHCGGWNVQPLLAWWKGAKVVLEREFEPARVLVAARGEARDDDDGRPGDLPLPLARAGVRRRRPLEPAPRRGRRRADAGGADPRLAGARHRDRPGLRADRGGAERSLPAARGRDAQDGLGRQAVPVRRGAARRGGGAAGARAERLPRLLAEPARRRRRCCATAGCTPATCRGRRRGLLPDSRPPEGHVHLRRRERLSGRGRERAARAPVRRGRGRRRRAGRALGRVGSGVRRREGAGERGRARSSTVASGSRRSRCRSACASSTRCRCPR